jgi:Cu+-exporting ATPase
MYCSTCKPIVEKQLKGDRAISKIDIDYMTDSVIVEYDSNLITRKKLKEKLENSGYKFVRLLLRLYCVNCFSFFLPF